MQLLRTLVDCDKENAEPALPRELLELYDGDLHFRASPAARPLVIANFVSTLDGVASYKIEGESGGSTISGSNPADKFIMGLLRASADAVMVGAGTLHDVSAESLGPLNTRTPMRSVSMPNTEPTHCINRSIPCS